jgi:signal transduction histidine kinase
MTKHTKSLDAEGTTLAGTAPVDVSPEAIAALVAAGASALHELPESTATAAGLPDALPLLVGITHDLRSPLSSMLVLIERLRAGHAGPVTPLQEKQLGLLYSAAFGVASLTNDALDMARGAARDVASAPAAPFSVNAVWREVRALVQPIAEEKQLVLRWSGLAHDTRVGYAAALHRVLLNLVTNALKFTTSGSVTVCAEALANNQVRFDVTDTGDGLPPQVRAQLHRSADSQAAGYVSSAGLGLAMCQQMLGAMGSRLEAAPESARTGTVLGFVLTLPAA